MSVAINARSRRSRKVVVGIETSNLRHSSPSSTGLLPVLTTYLGPRTAAAGFIGTICPVMSQSKQHPHGRELLPRTADIYSDVPQPLDGTTLTKSQ